MGGLLELLRRRDQVARRLLGVAEQMVQIGAVAPRQEAAEQLGRLHGLPRLQVSDRALDVVIDGCGSLRCARRTRWRFWSGRRRRYRDDRGEHERHRRPEAYQ
ncbi:MAG: hypothetical protein DMF82_03455 [Acidobacteria bacterium]|nr:MAG: hypothetical protein DMF82_03455 [Acidobacteriota bacterium]